MSLLEMVNIKSLYKKESLDDYKKLIHDPEKRERLENSECVICYYLTGFGGAAMTYKPCLICQKEINSGSTNIDEICIDCAKANNLCKHCFAEIDYKQKRKEIINPTETNK